MSITYACVRFQDDKQCHVIPIDNLKIAKIINGKKFRSDYHPKDKKDFSVNTSYYALWRNCSITCTENHMHSTYYKVDVFILGGKQIIFFFISKNI